jgi:hypothetical protein
VIISSSQDLKSRKIALHYNIFNEEGSFSFIYIVFAFFKAFIGISNAIESLNREDRAKQRMQ